MATCPVQHDGSRIILDPLVRDHLGEGALLRAAGPIAPVDLMGVPMWAVTHHAEARRLLMDRRLVKGIEHWGAWQRGEIPATWPLIGLAAPGPSMLTFDGEEHRRLRTLAAQALTARRVEAMRPRIEEITARLLDELETRAAGAEGPVDLKQAFAYELPVNVINELMGVGDADHVRLRELYDAFFSSQTPPEQVPAVIQELNATFRKVVEHKKANPGDDLTSALLAAQERGDHLTDEEILSTLQVMVLAGHETTISLIVSATIGLLGNPEQLAKVRGGEASWSDVVEETLRWAAPTHHVLIRFATEDVAVGDTVIPEGDALIVSYGPIGRDEQQFGPTACEFDVTRSPNKHISFGHGPHICIGAALARLEGVIALPALFERFPDMALAVPVEELRHKPVMTQNDLYELPLLLHGA